MACNDALHPGNVKAIAAAIVSGVLIIMVLGVLGNTAASHDTARIAVACVSHGGKWISATADCLR